MSDILKQFEKWKNKLDEAVNNALENEVLDEVKKVMKEEIQERVYDAYTPTQYIRRKQNGGLLDDKNIKHHLSTNNHTLYVQNITDNGFTVETVETGMGYTWENSSIYKNPFPRPFHKPSEEELINSGRAKKALIKGIRTRGIK